MLRTIFLKQKKLFFKYAIFFFLAFSIIALSVTSIISVNLNEVQKSALLNSEQRLLSVENAIISSRLNKITGDLLFITDSFKLNDNENADYSELEKEWVAFSNRRMIYDQIRFIDTAGNEIIRVNYGSGGASLVDQEHLQNKNDRYYFTDTINLKEDQIYISKLDLNVENGEIEQPIKPMIRISMPCFDQNGELKGIIVLNYLANDLLSQVKQISLSGNGEIYMLNSDGYWLFDSQNSDNEWAFMYDDKADISFKNRYPDEWNEMQKSADGYEINKDGVFLHSKIITGQEFSITHSDYSFVLGAGDWILVSHMPAGSENGMLFTQSFGRVLLRLLRENMILYISLLAIALVIAGLMSVNKNKKEQIKYFSEYDVMTGIFNRRAGMQKLAQLQMSLSKSSCRVSVCFIDINSLKEVNDTLGHEAGDELILSIVAGIKKNIRQNDFAARLGGDEFLVIFEGLDADKTEQIWQRILRDYTLINQTENRKYIISASHGIETLGCDSGKTIDDILNSADEKMYEEKRVIKQDLKVLRERATK